MGGWGVGGMGVGEGRVEKGGCHFVSHRIKFNEYSRKYNNEEFVLPFIFKNN